MASPFMASLFMAMILLFMVLSSCSGSFIDPGVAGVTDGSSGVGNSGGFGGGGGLGGGGSGGGSSGGSSGGNSSSLSGTYTDRLGDAITFSGSTFKFNFFGMEAASGTYKVSGSTLTLTVTKVSSMFSDMMKAGDKSVWTIVDATTIRDDHGETYTKK